MESQTNMPEFAVGELAGAIKGVLREAFGRVRVRGEITECKRYPSGHIYLSLKDADAKLEAVVWKMSVRNLAVQPENGLEVIATGRIDTYADRSKYQLVIDRLEYAGEGALLARIEKLRLALMAEGLFAPERKRAIPLLPARVGVVTSEKGAVLQDIRTTIARRFPRPILLWPVQVQGQGSAELIARAIDGMGALPPHLRPDVLIVARGGGSLEDLMAFNEEVVVRAVANCPIPVISAVGHETDTTLIDFASDRRAPTPTAAAEMAVPARIELLADLSQRGGRLHQAVQARLERARGSLLRAERGLPAMPDILASLRQRLDDRGERLRQALPGLLAAKRAALTRLHLPHPREGIAARRGALALLAERLRGGFASGQARRRAAPVLARFNEGPVLALLRERRTALGGLAARLESVSYQAVLARGFALVRDARGRAVTHAAEVKPGAALTIAFQDGEAHVRAEKPRPDTAQGSLF
ncbi:exodeoxyribonuclease VII large subunit [Rhodovarius lipocyclicus]|uniref:exodeoxyribonuclease VII large subunit n=1 Tax=Rhodovarius lipocyclicus TaxID=268410 RepID=UPI00135699FD|nr:exodeoxyribonuclease VII large subunit [Rhodovarius lipocyclicus]